MKHHRLGNSGLLVSELCLGTMIFGQENALGASAEESKKMIDYFLETGGNFIDTANAYAGGKPEEIIGQALKGRRQDTLIATKARFGKGRTVNDTGLSRYALINEVEGSLRRLQTDYIDVYYVHMWDPLTPIEETMRALDHLVQSGKVRYIGLSNFKAWEVMKSLATSDAHGWVRFVAAQYQHSLVNRDIEAEFTDIFLNEGLGSVVWGPLGGGFLSGKYRQGERPQEGRVGLNGSEVEEAWERRNVERNWRIIEVIGDIAKNTGKSYSQIAINWLLNRKEMSSVILGARTMDQLKDNMGSTGWSLTSEQVNRLNEVSQIDHGYPYRMIKGAKDRVLEE